MKNWIKTGAVFLIGGGLLLLYTISAINDWSLGDSVWPSVISFFVFCGFVLTMLVGMLVGWWPPKNNDNDLHNSD